MSNLDRRALELVRAVATQGTVSAAAAQLHLTQSAVTKQVAKLEQELGLQLFVRSPSGMRPTAAGTTLVELGGELLARFNRAEAILQARFLGTPTFRITAPFNTAENIIPLFMAARNPPIADVVVRGADQVDAELDRSADLAVSTVQPPTNRHRLRLAEIPITLQSAQRHPSGGELAALGNELLFTPSTGVGAVVANSLRALNSAATLQQVSTGTVAQALAANGHGSALVTETARFGLSARQATMNGPTITVALHASWGHDHPAKGLLQSIAEELRDWLALNPTWAVP